MPILKGNTPSFTPPQIPDLKRSKSRFSAPQVPDLKWSKPDLKWSKPDLNPPQLPDLKWSKPSFNPPELPDLKWSKPSFNPPELPDLNWSKPSFSPPELPDLKWGKPRFGAPHLPDLKVRKRRNPFSRLASGSAADALMRAQLARTSRQLAHESSDIGEAVGALKSTIKLDRRKARMARRRRLAANMVVGAVLMYHLDPDQGRARRAATTRAVRNVVGWVQQRKA